MRRHLLLADALAWPLNAPQGLARGAARLHVDWLRAGFADHVQRHGRDANAPDVGEAIWGPGGAAAEALGPAPLLVEYLQWLSGALLWRDGDEARLRELRPDWLQHNSQPGAHPVVGGPGEELLLWRALSLQLPPALLLAAMPDPADRPPWRVCLLPPQLRFSRPTAHLHGHYGQATATDEAWARLPESLEARLATEPRGAGRASGLSGPGLLLRARLFERRLVHHLRAHPGGIGDCPACAAPDTAWVELTMELVEHRSGLGSPVGQDLREEEGLRLLKEAAPLPGEGQGDLQDQAAEPWRLTHALRQILREDEADPTVQRAVAQLLRARAALHRRLVMDPAKAGLRAFREGPEAAGGAALPLPGAQQVRQSMGARHLDVRATELRSAPTKPEEQVKHAILSERHGHVAAAETGWVPHLSRTVRRGDADPGARWAHGARALAQADALLAAVQAAHDRGERPLRALRGVDLAGDERAGPLWLMRPALRRLREALDPIAAAEGLPAPGLTVHCGEDFAHLLSGLRAVHEPLRCGLWRQGDRLGHALALGVEPARWARDRRTVPMHALERALDLVWARETAGRLGVALTGGELLRLDQELDTLAAALGLAPDAQGGPGGGPAGGRSALVALDRALWALSAEDLRGLAGRGTQDPSLGRDELAPLHALIRSGHIDGGRWVEVATGPDLPLIDRLSSALARELADRQVLIELCPSSNMLIGALHAPLDQRRLWTRGLSADDASADDLRALPLCLSADDPMAFCTTIEDEVAYAWAGMVVAGGLPAAWARGWIDEALSAAWRGRFTLPAGA